MSFNKQTIKDVNLKGKCVLLRADYNVPVKDGKITDDYRIKQSLETVKYILEQGPKSLVIISHLGRPKGPADKQCSLKPVAERLSKLLDKPVSFAQDCVGEAAKTAAASLKEGGVLVLENVRFHPEEEKNDKDFAKEIVDASGAEVFVQDGFGVVHRAHATTSAVAELLPSVAGLLLAGEVDTITRVMEDPEKPLVAVIGGAKIADKIDVLNKFIEIADYVAVAGAMANNFLFVEGVKVGKSLLDKDDMVEARKILALAKKAEQERNFSFLVPVDVVVSKSVDGRQPTRLVDISSHSVSSIQSYPKIPARGSYTIATDEMILDIGPISAGYIAGAIKLSKTVVWNGTCGVTETKGIAGADAPFSHATRMIVDAMIGETNKHKNKPFSLVGGGDTVGYVESEGLVDDFNHVSTGGGASLELMAGEKLPGVEALEDKPAGQRS